MRASANPIFRRRQLGDICVHAYSRSGRHLPGLCRRRYLPAAKKHILYHPNPDRIGQTIPSGTIGDALQAGVNGCVQEDSPSGIDSLVGYAVVPTAKWAIVTVRTTDNTLLSLQGLMVNVLHQITPLTLLTLLAVWLLSRLISRPLGLLARSANDLDRVGISDDTVGAGTARGLVGQRYLVPQRRRGVPDAVARHRRRHRPRHCRTSA